MGKKTHGKIGEQQAEIQALEQSLKETRLLLAQAFAGFNSASDGELVESFIYEIQALQTRYSYLHRRRKALELPAVSPAVQGKPTPKSKPSKPLGGKALEEVKGSVLPVA